MTSRRAVGSVDHTRDRGPHKIEQLAGRLDEKNTPAARARQVVDELVANGAELRYRPPESMLPASCTYELTAGGDRHRCRQLIAEAKGNPLVWAAMLRVIAELEASGGLQR